MPTKPKRPRDINALGVAVAKIATGETVEPEETSDPEMVARGRKGGLKGGKARASKLTPEQRREIARKAAQARWSGLKE